MALMPARRRYLAALAGLACAPGAWALSGLHGAGPAQGETVAPVRLDPTERQAFRAWFIRIVEAQLQQGPTPRWTHRDCAGLVRFAVAEALADHDERWRRAMGFAPPLPPEHLAEAKREALRHRWRRPDGSQGAYVGALGLVQENTRLRSREVSQAEPGDLLFFDQGQDQHLMVWTGRQVVYHTGAAPLPGDDGLRGVALKDLMHWSDNRWRPESGNPNFAGVYQLAFLL